MLAGNNVQPEEQQEYQGEQNQAPWSDATDQVPS